MPATQLRLLPAPQPLVERLGVEFFRAIPRLPGVYRMFDPAGRLIYVGKASDLHARVASYRRTHGQSRKTVRLIHATHRVEWVVCADEVEARLRENELIRTLRPGFNRVGTWPRSARFLGLRERPGGFRLEVLAEPAGESYGAFRGGLAGALGALARLLWLAWHSASDFHALPQGLAGRLAVRTFEAGHTQAPAWLPAVRAFFAAGDDDLLGRLVAAVPQPPSSFGRAFVALQFEVLTDFHRRGPDRNRRLRAELAPTAERLTPEELDDLLVRAHPRERVPAFRPDP